ncbi:unnamed protein product, partial [Allacma fusca]
ISPGYGDPDVLLTNCELHSSCLNLKLFLPSSF